MTQQKLFKVRDKRNKGWFYLDNEYLNGIGKHLGPTGIAVYVSLCRHADDNQSCFPSQELIAKEIGSTDRSVRTHLKKLEELNIIKAEKVRTSEGKWLNNTYYLVDKSEWIYPEETISCGKPEEINDTAIGKKRHSHRKPFPIKNTNINNTNKKKTNSFFKKKPFYQGMEMRYSKNKWWCLPADGGAWLEFTGDIKDIEWR
jgi:DNA-binding transcriptional ArsR family regulator